MSPLRPLRFALVVGAAAAALGLVVPTQASVITTTPTLPVLGVPYVSSGGAGCFAAAGVCIVPGTITLTSLVSTTFDAGGQDIVANVAYAGMLTALDSTPIGPVDLFGTMEQEVLGRTSSTEIGAWTTELIALTLSGPVLGHTLTLGLDGSHASTGFTSIESIGTDDEPRFRIDSFFDVFVELSLDSNPPLSTTRGPIHAALAVPEPGSLALAACGLLAAAWGRRRTSRQR